MALRLDVQADLVKLLGTPAMHLDIDLFRQFAAQIVDVHSRTPINLGRIFACEKPTRNVLASCDRQVYLTGG